jgi:2-polyprenyl-3-methyl-5-hydroxy-6-metoxy-1,4-benzoquinol methylase
MASIEQNKQWWNGNEWEQGGNEWSSEYGTPVMQWYASLLPRIHQYLPASTILEIAPGFGRWTTFLKSACQSLILVDLSEKCIAACKERFKQEKHIAYHVNDGRSLHMVTDNSIDFMFSFDSLVHVEKDVLQNYLKQLSTKLKPNGVGFIHHSNMGEFSKYFRTINKLPRGRGMLSGMGLVEPGDHARAHSVTADIFVSLAAGAGLKVVSQEVVNWGTQRTIDCISIFTHPGSVWDREFQRWVNGDFRQEAKYIGKLAKLYDRST